MNRRRFIQSFILFPLSFYVEKQHKNTLSSSNISPHIEKNKLINVPVAGFQYYQGENLWMKLKLGDSLSLSRETDNKFDSNATLIKWGDHQLGYIPRSNNQSVAKLMDEGKTLVAEISQLKQSENPWKRIEVSLYQVSVS